MVLEGDNLWFCHQIQVGSGPAARTVRTPAPDMARCSIQFNYTPTSNEDFLVDSKAEEIQVTLYSHFAKPLRDQTATITCKVRIDVIYMLLF